MGVTAVLNYKLPRTPAAWRVNMTELISKPADTESRKSVAYHEAGHAVLDIFFGFPVQIATIIATDDFGGRVVGPSVRELNFDHVRFPRRERRMAARQTILSLYAGRAAQLLATPHADPEDWAGDDQKAMLLSEEFGVFPRYMSSVGDEFHFRYMERLRRESGKLVRRLQAPIRAVAESLFEKKTMTGGEIEAITAPFLRSRDGGEV